MHGLNNTGVEYGMQVRICKSNKYIMLYLNLINHIYMTFVHLFRYIITFSNSLALLGHLPVVVYALHSDTWTYHCMASRNGGTNDQIANYLKSCRVLQQVLISQS